jgi:hypothetical protein
MKKGVLSSLRYLDEPARHPEQQTCIRRAKQEGVDRNPLPEKSQRWESNPQPPHYECGALPIEATLASGLNSGFYDKSPPATRGPAHAPKPTATVPNPFADCCRDRRRPTQAQVARPFFRTNNGQPRHNTSCDDPWSGSTATTCCRMHSMRWLSIAPSPYHPPLLATRSRRPPPGTATRQ